MSDKNRRYCARVAINKRGDGLVPLTANEAWRWHQACPCQERRKKPWMPLVKGRGREGDWASAWLAWLWRTHIEPRGFKLVGHPSSRVMEVQGEPDDAGFHERMKAAIQSGPVLGEEAPPPPAHLL